MMEKGCSTGEVMMKLGLTEEQLKLALTATSPTDHDIRGFDLHVCPRPNPWELLEAEEVG